MVHISNIHLSDLMFGAKKKAAVTQTVDRGMFGLEGDPTTAVGVRPPL